MTEQFSFHDVSYANGAYNMALDKNPVIAMKMSGFYYGSHTGYLDSQAAANYRNAIRMNKLPMLYHFAGGGNPNTEADYFCAAVAPYAKGDVYVLDYELTAAMNPPANPVQWCLAFVERVHARTGVFPIFYSYASMVRQYNWTPVLALCGLWVADYATPPTGNVNTNGHPYIFHQYTDRPLDTSASFITLDTLKKYAYGYGNTAPKVIADVTPTKEIHVTTTNTKPVSTTTVLPSSSSGTLVASAPTVTATTPITDIKPGVPDGTTETGLPDWTDKISTETKGQTGQDTSKATTIPVEEEELKPVGWFTRLEAFVVDLVRGL